MVVNNNASAVFLMLEPLLGKEVIVSRGELVEIGVLSVSRTSCASPEQRWLKWAPPTGLDFLIMSRPFLKIQLPFLKFIHPIISLKVLPNQLRSRNLWNLQKPWALLFSRLGKRHLLPVCSKGLRSYPLPNRKYRKVSTFSVSALTNFWAPFGGNHSRSQKSGREDAKASSLSCTRADKVTLGLLESVLGAYFEPESLKEKVTGIRLLERVRMRFGIRRIE